MQGLLTLDGIEALSDAELVAMSRERGGRDDRPYRELIRRHQNTVWRVCYNFVKNAEDAEDLAQEVFLKAYRNLDRFEGRSTFKTWVYRIAINTSQNELRRRSRRPQESQTPLETAAEFIPSTQNVEELVTRNSRYELLSQAMRQLRPVELQILMMKDVEGRPYQDIAEELGISLSAAKMRVQRARGALKTKYHQLARTEETL